MLAGRAFAYLDEEFYDRIDKLTLRERTPFDALWTLSEFSKPAIFSSLADTPCATLGLHGLLERLNITLGTSLTLDTPALASLFEDCIANNCDFGAAYDSLRTAWYTLKTGRAWDLCSNRVMPTCTIGEPCPHPISHAWVDEKERTENGGPREHLRAEEWKLDVPTIGFIYRYVPVSIYLSGLGHPLSVEQDYFERARIEGQEICGVTPNGPLDAKPDKGGKYNAEALTTFHQKLQSLVHLQFEPFRMLEETQHRVSTNPVDRIDGNGIPPGIFQQYQQYNESQCLEDAWTALLTTSSVMTRGALFFW
ncbi:hypothetical protein IW261DRAFT_1415852 [Armillaria novae-zelandiae]|uniref:Uncharacterized protein n=1 Tax=Armillaria novae-zelandiae TaxID=153914 RepID=A0AA39PKJ7_9AGAR|nr:hypothetical protein IW261DRAFT_1415852 [Armillaria novae-zelandiae]